MRQRLASIDRPPWTEEGESRLERAGTPPPILPPLGGGVSERLPSGHQGERL